MAVERFAVEHEIDMHDLDRRHQLIQLRFKLIERGGDEPVIQHGRHRLNAVFDLVLNAVIKLSEAPISVTKMVRLVSSVIKAENFVVNRIPVLTPRVNDYPMNHQAPVPARLAASINLLKRDAYYQRWRVWQWNAYYR